MQDKPYVINETKGTKAYCTCDKSENMPYCDGAHKGTDFVPCVVEIDADKTVAICACGKAETMPYCDGAHSK